MISLAKWLSSQIYVLKELFPDATESGNEDQT